MAGFVRTALGVAVSCTALVGMGAGTAFAAPYDATAMQFLSTETPQPGDTVTDTLSGWGSGETITVFFFSSPQRLFTVIADVSGSASRDFVVPADACGDHTVVAKGSLGERVVTSITVAGECHNNHHDGAGRSRRDSDCEDWRDPGYWIKNCDTPDDGWDSGFDAAYSAPLPAQHSSNKTMAGVVGLGLLTPALLSGGLLIARRRGR